MDAERALLLMQEACGPDEGVTVHTIDGYDGANRFCVHPTSAPDEEYRAPTLDEACEKAIAALALDGRL